MSKRTQRRPVSRVPRDAADLPIPLPNDPAAAAPPIEGEPQAPPPPPTRSGEETTFAPTPKQLQFLELVQSQRDPSSVRQLCSLGVVSRGGLYRWQQHPAFNAWFGRQISQHLFTHNGMLLVTSLNAALNGDDRMAQLMLKFLLNPKGMPALTRYLEAAPAADAQAAPTPPPTPDTPHPAPTLDAPLIAPPEEEELIAPPLPSGVIGTTYRLLSSLDGLIGESDRRAAQRADQFAKHLTSLKDYADLENSLLAPPPSLFRHGHPLIPERAEVDSLVKLRTDDWLHRMGNDDPVWGFTIPQHHQIYAECRADLIAARAGHVCRVARLRPLEVPVPLDRGNGLARCYDLEDTEANHCEYSRVPPAGPTPLEFLDAFTDGDLATAQRGLAAGLPIHIRSANDLTPFSLAARNGQIEMFELACLAARVAEGELDPSVLAAFHPTIPGPKRPCVTPFPPRSRRNDPPPAPLFRYPTLATE